MCGGAGISFVFLLLRSASMPVAANIVSLILAIALAAGCSKAMQDASWDGWDRRDGCMFWAAFLVTTGSYAVAANLLGPALYSRHFPPVTALVQATMACPILFSISMLVSSPALLNIMLSSGLAAFIACSPHNDGSWTSSILASQAYYRVSPHASLPLVCLT